MSAKKHGPHIRGARQFIDQVKKVLVRHGWTQGEFQDAGGRRCLLGAINHVHDTCRVDKKAGHSAKRRIIAEIGKVSGARYPNIVGWNDYHRRNLQEILQVLDRAKARRTSPRW